MNNLQKNILSNKGFTYLMALILIVIMGIMLGAIGQSWQTIMKREKEAELIFRGSQIKDAITAWNTPAKSVGQIQQVATPLTDLKHLLEDPRTVDRKRYLRRMYTDPVTDKDWVIIRDPIKGIIGVASSSPDKPLKVDNFPDNLKDLAGKEKYSDWKFIFVPAGQPTVTPPGPSIGGYPIAPNPFTRVK